MNQNLQEISEIELIELLCSEEDDSVLYEEFTNRFLPDVLEECKRICTKRKLDNHIGRQIAHETFERVRKYKSFKKDQVKIPDNKKAILIYLIRVSTRLFADHHKKEKRNDIVHKTYFDDIYATVSLDVDVQELKKKKDLAVSIFSKLNAKEQKVVLKDIEYKKHQKYLPDDVTESLAVELGVKNNTITKIRARAIEKIKKAIDEINQSEK